MKHGDFLWCDVMTSDPRAAADFYSAVVGWGVTGPEVTGMDYTVLTVEGQGVAGIMSIPDEQKGHPPAWTFHVAVDDVDAAAAKLKSLGGSVQKGPWEVPGVIRLAAVSDPQGAGFLLARGLREEAMRAFAPRTIGTVGWHELMADDWRTIFPFYEAMFGWTKAEAFEMGGHGTYQLFAHGGDPIGGMMSRPPRVPVAYWGVYFNVDAAGAAAERVKAQGGEVLMGPHQAPTGDWIVQCRDPQGAYFAVTSDKA